MLGIISNLFRELDKHGIRYCHWKSNQRLRLALVGASDLDLLIDPAQRNEFDVIVRRMGFKLAEDSQFKARHYFGMDLDSSDLVHLDVMDSILTGGSIIKNYRIPATHLVLGNLRKLDGIPVPIPEVELAMLTLRKALESSDLIEAVLLLRELRHVRHELAWLLEQTTVESAIKLLSTWLPEVSIQQMPRFLNALGHGGLLARWYTGRQMARSLRGYKVQHDVFATLRRISLLKLKVINWKLGRPIERKLGTGGRLIAVVGTDGSGKSTLSKTLESWLRSHVATTLVHTGKPESAWLTAIPNAAISLIRRLITKRRATIPCPNRYEDEKLGSEGTQPSIWRQIRALILAYDRFRLLRKVQRLRSLGLVVIADRYPTKQPGLTDGPLPTNLKTSIPLQRLMSLVEMKLYCTMPLPDVVIALNVSLDVAIARHKSRRHGNPLDEPLAYIIQRHASFSTKAYSNLRVVEINADAPSEEVANRAKRIIWDVL